MTYIVAFGQPGFNAMLADTRLSWRSGTSVLEGRDGDLKIGLLFRGCIYGSVGSVSATREFIRSFKESIHGSTDDILGFWHRFERFVGRYPFPSAHQRFQLVLSHRGIGVPRFAVLDSTSGLDQRTVPHDYYLLAYGSGRTALDAEVEREFAPRLKKLQQFLLSEKQVPKALIHRLSPYFLCLWLSERSLTFEASQLASHGVGGVFHFAWQSADMEEPQRPAVYIFSGADRATRMIWSWVYRVAAVQGGLYVESHSPETEHSANVRRLVSFDPAARYDVEAHTDAELRELVEKELAALPFHYFCGLGFVEPSDRRSFGFLASSHGKREDIFDSSGRLAPFIRARVAENFGAP